MQENLAAVFRNRVETLGDRRALIFKENKSPYRSLSWHEFGELTTELACGLASLGIESGDKVAIFSQTAHTWTLADLATISNGAVTVPIYPTSSTSDLEFILNNSGARLVFAQNEKLMRKVAALVDKGMVPAVETIVLMSHSVDTIPESSDRCLVHTMETLRRLGQDARPDTGSLVYGRTAERRADDLATIIYTSGTTGTPKGVPLTHRNIISVLHDLRTVIPISENDVYLSYLPMSHVFERVCGEYYWLYSGGACAFAEGIEYMAKNMAEVHPSMILTVPRVLDRIYSKVRSGIEGTSPRRKQLIEWCIEAGKERVRLESQGRQPGTALKVKLALAEKLVLAKIRERIGANLRLIVSGGAPATPEVLTFFNAIGIPTLEGYGLTETAAPLSVNPPEKVKIGTVGAVLKSVKAKVDEDGEILVSGPSIFNGYFKNDEFTQEAFQDGWFKTGDIGTIDSDGYVTITDRKKDILVNSAGKNIAPQKIEAIVRTIPLVTQAVVFGDKERYLVALISVDEQTAMDYAREAGWGHESFEELKVSKELNEYLRKEIKARSGKLAEYEQVKRVAVLPEELSVEAGELTATLKIKRNAIKRNYAGLIKTLYEDRKATVGASR